MTESVEEITIVELSDFKEAVQLATTGLDEEHRESLNKIITELHFKVTSEMSFKNVDLSQLAEIGSFDYEISRKWFKGKSLEHQLIAMLIDAVKSPTHTNRALWLAVILYLSLILQAHGKKKESQRLSRRFKTAYFYKTPNYQWIWNELPNINQTEEVSPSFILNTVALMLNRLNENKAEAEANRVRGIIEAEATTKFRDKKLNQISEIKKCIEVAYYPHRKSPKKPSKPKTKPKTTSTDKDEGDGRTKKLRPPKLSDNAEKKPIASFVNNVDTPSSERDWAVLDFMYPQDSTIDFATIEEAIDVLPPRVDIYCSTTQPHNRGTRSFELDAVDFSVKQQHISLRELELPSDVNMLSAASCKLVFNRLVSDCNSEKKKISLMAAPLLLTMITACPVASLIEKGFIEESGLFFIGKRKGYLQSRLGITMIEEYSDNNLNSTDLIKIPLPVSLLQNAIEASKSQVKVQDIEAYVKRLKESLNIVYLTISRIESALHFILRRYVDGSNFHIADIICRIDASQAAAKYYSSHSHQELIGHYKKALQLMNIHNCFDLAYIQSHSEDFLTGSGFALKTESVRQFFQRLRQWVLESQDGNQLFNRFSIFTWYCFCILTGVRPNNGLPNAKDLDLEVGWYQVADKPNRVTQNHRLIPLCESLKKLFKLYRSYLKAIDRPYSIELSTAIYSIKSGIDAPFLNLLNAELDKLTPIKRGNVSKMTQELSPFHDPYGTRHFVRVNLERQGLSMTLINAVIGHEKHEEEALHSYSSVSKAAIKNVDSNFEQIALELGLQDFSDIICKIIEVHPFVKEYISSENC